MLPASNIFYHFRDSNNIPITMKLKEGVRVLGVKPELVMAIMIAEGVYRDNGVEMVITSITDSKHSTFSRHYQGYAFDLRTRNIPDSKRGVILEQIKERLTKDFNVIDEGDHFHIGYKPQFS